MLAASLEQGVQSAFAPEPARVEMGLDLRRGTAVEDPYVATTTLEAHARASATVYVRQGRVPSRWRARVRTESRVGEVNVPLIKPGTDRNHSPNTRYVTSTLIDQ